MATLKHDLSKRRSTSRTEVPTQQKLRRLDIDQLKGLRDVSLDFTGSYLTAIMGSNCSGKTTVLHALACAFQPLWAAAPDYRFPKFFRPNNDASWEGSNFSVIYSQRIGERGHIEFMQRYAKTLDRWTPKYDRRPKRFTRFVGIAECVPDIEIVNLQSRIHYDMSEKSDTDALPLRQLASVVLNRDYSRLYDVKYRCFKKPSYGVTTGDVRYSGLSMSSGEQRVFRILDAVLSSPKYSLLLIDEIDLFLHQDALKRLLDTLSDHCKKHQKQLVFTTHFPPVAHISNDLAVYTLQKTPAKTILYLGYSFDALQWITGKVVRPLHCYIEDDVAETIARKVAADEGVEKYTTFTTFGPCENAFTIAAGICLVHNDGNDLSESIFVMDGDIDLYRTKEQRLQAMEKRLTGSTEKDREMRKAAVRRIRSLSPPSSADGKRLSPEQCLHAMLKGLDFESQPPADRALLQIVSNVVSVADKHDLLKRVIEETGMNPAVALSKLVDLASESDRWAGYTRVLRRWFAIQKRSMKLGVFGAG